LAEPVLRKYVQEQMTMLAEPMAGRLSADREAGLLPAAFDPQLVVPVIVTYLQGLWRTLRRAPHNTIQCGAIICFAAM
jgi:TetR/AcrR family transcriptional regulator, transcriptional repressor for nem operon